MAGIDGRVVRRRGEQELDAAPRKFVMQLREGIGEPLKRLGADHQTERLLQGFVREIEEISILAENHMRIGRRDERITNDRIHVDQLIAEAEMIREEKVQYSRRNL